MEINEYRKEFLSMVKVSAETDKDSTVTSFVKEASDFLLEAGIIPDYEECFYTGYGKHNRRYRIDGYAYDDYDMTMYLIIADYSGSDEPETLTLAGARTCFDRLQAFLDEALSGTLYKEMELSTPAFDLVENLKNIHTQIKKYCFVLETDKVASDRIETLPYGDIHGTQIEFHIWDMRRFYRVVESQNGRDEIIIDLYDYSKDGLPCLEASSANTAEYRCYLCVFSANVLGDIYDKFGSRLLEGNVRAFLTTKRAVNKKIRETILTQPSRFFAYNNGISATATEVVMEKSQTGLVISKIKGFQIVNGGQTTASLSNARFKDNASLDNIYVQMKLTEVDPALARSIIPAISRSSNSQNKVSEADFFSNHAFHIQMEKMSRKIFASAVNGAQYETHWFYERANGQYMQEQYKMKKSEKQRFLLLNPPKQKIIKTDLAKALNAWRCLPNIVCLGAQKNFSVFADWITDEWEKNSLQYNELFYKKSLALVILFRQTGMAIKQQPWYENGYLANLIAYSMSKFSFMLSENIPDMELDLMQIWDKQRMPDILPEQLIPVYKVVFKALTAEDRPTQNVTEWSKSSACWSRIKAVSIPFHPSISDILIDRNEMKGREKSARREQKMISGIEAQMVVVNKGQAYWQSTLSWASKKNLPSPEEIKLLQLASTMSGTRVPNEVQSKRLLEINDRILAEGYSE